MPTQSQYIQDPHPRGLVNTESVPELYSIKERLTKANSEYSTLLYENLRTPPQESKGIANPEPSDFVQTMSQQLTYTEQHNDRLQKVLDHVKRIIG